MRQAQQQQPAPAALHRRDSYDEQRHSSYSNPLDQTGPGGEDYDAADPASEGARPWLQPASDNEDLLARLERDYNDANNA